MSKPTTETEAALRDENTRLRRENEDLKIQVMHAKSAIREAGLRPLPGGPPPPNAFRFLAHVPVVDRSGARLYPLEGELCCTPEHEASVRAASPGVELVVIDPDQLAELQRVGVVGVGGSSAQGATSGIGGAA